MKICLIGPTHPFRGGIAHHTTLLFRNLRKRHDVTFFTFKRQYPRWLFPGRTDVDRSEMAIKEDGGEAILDSLNPYSWWNVFRKIKKVNPDLVIIPWWVSFWTPQFWTIASLVRQFTQAKILFLCHNVVAHESRSMDGFFTKLVLKKGDYFVVHSDDDWKNLRKVVPPANVKKVFHPSYDVFDAKKISKEKAQQKLGIEGPILLSFGFVRPYKGLKYLIESMPLILERLNVTLLIVGEFWEDKDPYTKRIETLGIGSKVRIVDEYVPNEDVQLYFAASDVVIMPYVSGTGSGIAQIAFGFSKPVIATNVGCLPEVIEDGETGLIVDSQSSEEISKAVIRFYEENMGEEFPQHIAQGKDRFSWDNLVGVIEKFLEH